MRDRFFENIFTGWKSANFNAEKGINVKNLGFLYRDDTEAMSDCILLYSKDKLELTKFVADIMYKADNHFIKVAEDSRYIKLGTALNKKTELTFYAYSSDIFKRDCNGKTILINEIEPVYLMVPLTEVYIYRLPVTISKLKLDSQDIKSLGSKKWFR